ncbi:MAG: glutathione S-transferase family protein [Methylococcales bacterium]
MINLYTANTFNGQRVSIMLEEIGLPYNTHKVDLAKGEQRQTNFLQLNPSGRIPVLLDQTDEESEPLVLTQSTAILQYLAEKTGKLLPESIMLRAKVYEWMYFHAVDIGSVIFSAFYLQRWSVPKQVEAAEQLRARVYELYQYFDQQLAKYEFIAGDFYSTADITALPAVISQEKKLTQYSNLSRWLNQLKQRPAVLKGLAVLALEVSHEN